MLNTMLLPSFMFKKKLLKYQQTELHLQHIYPSSRVTCSCGIIFKQPCVQHGVLCARLPFPVISTGNKTRGSSREDSRSESSLVSGTFCQTPRFNSFKIRNICIKSVWRSGEKETLAGSWRRERMLQTSTTGTGESQPAHLLTYSSHLDANMLKNTRH